MVSDEGFEPPPHAPKAWTLPGYANRSIQDASSYRRVCGHYTSIFGIEPISLRWTKMKFAESILNLVGPTGLEPMTACV